MNVALNTAINSIGLIILVALSGCASAPDATDAPSVTEADRQAKALAEVFDPKGQKTWDDHPFTASAEYHFSLAQAYANEGRVDRAIEEYRAALAYDPKSAILHGKLAAEYVKKGETSLAVEFCEKALKLDPAYTEVMLMLGGIYAMNEEHEAALKQYEAVLKVEPENDEAAVFKTQVLVESEKMKEALTFIRAFVAKTKDSAAAWYYTGKLEQAHDQMEAAIRSYRKALGIRPGFVQATLALGMIFETHAQNKKAIELYQDQLEQRLDIHVANRLATLHLKANQLPLAQKVLETVAELDPEDLNTRLKMGLIFMQQKEWAQAQAVFVALLKTVPDSDKVNFYLAAVLEEQGRWEDAIPRLSAVSTDSNLFEEANLHIVELHRKMFRPERAISHLENALKRSPETSGLYVAMAGLYEDQKELGSSANTLSKGLSLFPDHEKMRYYYGAVLDKQGKQDEAVLEMEKVIAQNPQHADALNFIAYTWTTQGVRLKDAEELLIRALKLKPRNAFILDSMGWNQFMLGKSKEALRYLESAAELNSSEPAILEHLAEVYVRNQMPERAQAMRNRIEQVNSGASRAPASAMQSPVVLDAASE